ncbi:hypothetical protein STLA111740_18120 [Stenotrophomonas lactitubi]
MGIVRAQPGDGADRESRREATAKAGGDDLIAYFHAGAERDVAQFQLVAAAVDDQAHAIAGHGHRHRVVGIGQQQHGGAARGHADHLAHQAAGIDHRLADVHAFAAAGVQHQALFDRVQVDVQDRRQLHVQTTALGHVQQFAQLRVVQRGGLQTGQAGVGQQQLVAQFAVLGHQLAVACGGIPHLPAELAGQAGQGPHRLHQAVGLLAQTRQPAGLVVEDDQGDCQCEIGQQP